MRHLRCLCFIRPSPESIQSLIEELRDPKYGEYNICRYLDGNMCTAGN
jgi:vacuolar protein sorting-associated protein 45